MIWTSKTATLLGVALPLLTLSIPLLDVSLSIVRRTLKQQPIFGADRGHIHHRLLDLGLSPRRAVLVLYVTALAAAGFGLLLTRPMIGGLQFLLMLGFSILVLAGVKQLRYAEFNVAKKMLLGEFQITMAAKLKLEQIVASLRKARTGQEWWTALVGACREAGWTHVSWTGAGSGPREQQLSEEATGWSFEVLLADGEKIRLEGPSAAPPLNLLEFAAVVKQSFSGLDREPERPARS